MIFFWSLFIFTPDRKDALLIIAGGQTMNFLTTDSTAKQIPHELSSFVVSELKNMAKEAQVDLGIQNQKEKILEQAKTMTATEIVEKMKVDSTFAKVILEK
jgi:D-arabinose 5-phosphate isomerase GutQ